MCNWLLELQWNFQKLDTKTKFIQFTFSTEFCGENQNLSSLNGFFFFFLRKRNLQTHPNALAMLAKAWLTKTQTQSRERMYKSHA